MELAHRRGREVAPFYVVPSKARRTDSGPSNTNHVATVILCCGSAHRGCRGPMLDSSAHLSFDYGLQNASADGTTPYQSDQNLFTGHCATGKPKSGHRVYQRQQKSASFR